MNIIIGAAHARSLSDKYTILTLDTFRIPGHVDPVTSYCVIDQMTLQDLAQAQMLTQLHENLITNYGKKNWAYCEQALEHLQGKWQGVLDTFYIDLLGRIRSLKMADLDSNWTPVIDRAGKDVVPPDAFFGPAT